MEQYKKALQELAAQFPEATDIEIRINTTEQEIDRFDSEWKADWKESGSPIHLRDLTKLPARPRRMNYHLPAGELTGTIWLIGDKEWIPQEDNTRTPN